MSREVILDCGTGRRMGCRCYCCYLLVRLDPDERPAPEPKLPAKGFVEKAADGRCVHLDVSSGRCGIWERRPRICRGFDCNRDPMLQIVLRDRFHSLVEFARAAAAENQGPKGRVPVLGGSDDSLGEPGEGG